MENLKRSLALFAIFFVIAPYFSGGLKAQDHIIFNNDTIYIDNTDKLIIRAVEDTRQITTADSSFRQYEAELGFEKVLVPCDCYPCAMACWEWIPKQPNYADYKQWFLEKYGL